MIETADIVRSHQSTGAKLSSSQDFRVLDKLLTNALIPLALETTAYREWLAEVVAFYIFSRRKQNDGLMAACVRGLCGAPHNPSDIVGTGIDRELIFTFLGRVTDIGAEQERCQVEYARKRSDRVEVRNLKALGVVRDKLGPSPVTAPATRSAAYWLKLSLSHKRSIIFHYLRLLLKVSSSANYASGGRIETDQAFQDAFIAADTAANRFRPDCGVFASFLGSYLKGSIRVTASHGMGLAAPGARVLSTDALQTDSIDGIEITDNSTVSADSDEFTVRCLDVISGDRDVRMALIVGDLRPPNAAPASSGKA